MATSNTVTAIEELSRVDGSVGIHRPSPHVVVFKPYFSAGNEAAEKEKYVSPLASGEAIGKRGA